MPRRSRADLTRLDDLAAAQRGLVTAAQLVELRLAPSMIHHRARTGGPWSRILPAVYLTAGGEPNRSQQRVAALLYAGATGVLTGVDALDLLGVRAERRPTPPPVHVLIDHAVRRTSVGFVLVERTRRLPTPTTRDGFAIAPIERAVVDHCRRLQRRGDVTALVARAVQLGNASVPRLEHEVAAAPRRNTALVREAVAAIGDGVASAPEAELRRLVLASALPTPLWNPDLVDATGAFIARPDAYWPDSALAVEVESREFHFEAADWTRTMERQSRMTSRGITVLPYPPSRLRQAPEAVLSEIAATRHALVGRPLPDVTVHPQRTAI